jgi:hypothetical protein
MTSIIVTSIQIYNVKMPSLKNITKSKVQKQMAKYGFGCTFHDLKYSKHGIFLIYFLNS